MTRALSLRGGNAEVWWTLIRREAEWRSRRTAHRHVVHRRAWRTRWTGEITQPPRGGMNAPGGGPRIIPGPGPIPGGGEPGPIPGCIGGGPPIMRRAGKPPIAPPIGGSDCTLSCKLAFRAGKNLPSLCMRTMGGSDACGRGFDGLGPNPPGSIGSRGAGSLLEPKVGAKRR